jgi:PAS domain S-box-containing protein
MEDGNIRVLLIEDNPDDAELLRRNLEKSANGNISLTLVRNLKDGLEDIARNAPDIILSDLGLPDSHGLDTVTKIMCEAPNIPLVVLSGFDDEATAIKAVQSGAQDYLVKGHLEGAQIERSLFYAIERTRLQTELEQHTQVISKIQANLHKILDKNADAIIVVGKDRQILFANPAAEVLLGRKRKDLIHKSFDFPLDKGEISEIEISHQDKKKTIAEMHVVEIDWEGSGAYLASLHDITKRKQSEQALKESETKFSKAFHSSANLFAINTLKDGKFIEVNESFTRMTGYTREEVIGHNANELNLWADEDEFLRITSKTRENERVHNEQIKIRNKSGEMRTGLFSSEQISINGEECFINTITDITELKRAEELLRVSEERFSIAFRASPNAISITTFKDGIFLDVNDTFIRDNGYTREEVIGRSSKELQIWVNLEERDRILHILRERGQAVNEEYRSRTKSGGIRTMLFSAEPINVSGEPCIIAVTTDITERKKAEEELRYSDTALKSFHEGVFAMDNEFVITRWNETCEQMFGIKASEAIGKSAADVITMVEEYPGQNLERVNLLIEKGFNKEEQIYRTARGDIWVDVHAQAIEDNGKRYGWVTMVSDITPRKKAEETLRFSDAAFKSIHESVIATDTDHIVTHWNKLSEEIYGIKASKAIGTDLEKLIDVVENHPGDNARRAKKIETDGYCREDQLHRTRHGEVWVDVTIQGIEENGKRYGWVILSSVITQRKLAEEALKRSEEKYRELISNSIDGIVSNDSQMKIIIWNKGAEKIFGYTEKEMLGQPINKIIPEREHQKFTKVQRSLNKAGAGKAGNRIMEGLGLRKDGREIPIELSVSSKKYEGNYIATAIIRDITERKEAEEKLRKIDQMKSEFLSNVSHELRTPLQSIGGFTKLLMNGQVPDPAVQQEFLQIIDRETSYLGNLINSLLDMSRLESGRFQINRSLVSIQETINDSIKSFQSLAREKNIALTENIPPELPEIEVDAGRLRQVFFNLLSNAIKYSDPGGKITFKAVKREDGLLFQVSDRGIGIPKEALQHLFERFYRAEDKLARGGTGLGLYITKQIIEAHGGRIWVESQVREGSTFSFSLPFNTKGGNGHDKENSNHRRRPGNIKAG